MKKVRVNLIKKTDNSYDIIIGKDLFSAIADGLLKLNLNKIGIITDSNVKGLYGNNLLSLLKSMGLDAAMISFNAGEESKKRAVKERIEDALVSYSFGRDSLIIALGGGVVGDIAGFVASTFMRGIPYLQIPTTLLAMVDSSIGGKTGVDTPHGKNLIGTFYQPKRVFIDIGVLKSLPKEEMLNGIAEMIKHGVIADEKFFVFMEDYMDKVLSLDEQILIKAIEWCCIIKKKVVEADEREESGERKALNFGHTIGHAVEKASNYKIKHGNAVALGMLAETKISEEIGMINSFESKKIINLVKKAGFDEKLGDIEIGKIIENTGYDKKNIGGRVKYVLPRKVGKADIDVEVNEEIVAKVLGEMQ
ncbi:MAG: 3-dehydroquinate synthase [Nanoarchaeota archaeon]|nr:3-dehydroquinate synthase [Thermodesulfovibrionia bacterium]MCK5281997.1 3-dehydroquinate synthase [Nanoarchaeota archaeon]